jgi:hypothetical protein
MEEENFMIFVTIFLVIIIIGGINLIKIFSEKSHEEKDAFCKNKFGEDFFVDVNNLKYPTGIFACCKLNENNDLICKYEQEK